MPQIADSWRRLNQTMPLKSYVSRGRNSDRASPRSGRDSGASRTVKILPNAVWALLDHIKEP